MRVSHPARGIRLVPVLLLFALALPGPAATQTGIAAATRALDSQDGYFPLHWDAQRGRLLLEIPRLDEDFLYLTSLATGVGSNALGLDRGEIMDEAIARFQRVGPRVLLVLQNPGFRAQRSATEALRRSVEESFPTSIVGSFDIVAEEGGRVLVDATAFFLRDAIDLTASLANQGGFRLEPQRSAIWLPRTRAFPENTEVEAALTFTSDRPGPEIRRHTPDGRSLTVRQHHSLVKLPEPGFEPRLFDPRSGIFSVSFYDFGKPFDEDFVTRYAVRHRLVKRDPGAAMSEPVEPIVYYLDPAVPEPYRSAFKEGGEWWNRVFEAAGFIDAFRIEDMPADMDPMDARYNVIQWVHRTQAGSSIGPSFRDPRTGEIIKAAVRMDSYRSHANYDVYAGAAGTEGDWIAGMDPGVSPEAFVMSRRRQHSAHEIGHTLGLAHNFIAISYGHGSVMDYPAPVIRVTDGRLDLSGAYRDGAGAWDTVAIRYAYEPVPAGMSEAAFLNGLLVEAQEQGWHFITNPDAGADNAHPAATWWVNGSDMLDELERVTEVRRFLIDRFDERAIETGEPLHKLQERFAPVYFHHRATYEAAIKTIGGMEYRYAVRGDPLPATTLLPPDRVERALDLLLAALQPAELAIPERVLAQLAPRSYGWVGGRTEFESAASPAFDQIGAARTLASDIVGGILHPARAARVVAFHARNPALPSLVDVVERLVDGTWGVRAGGQHAELQRVVQRVVVDELLDLASHDDATPEARAAAEWGLRRVLARAAE
ncbi:MAG TPA: zinc-dependent metalloprotease, partial [Longimicrobiales bacterium]|nr:zinc-dependent metalloprotease [Longimicrobiales bacterium]